MTHISEIAPDTYRISTYIPEVDLQFNQFLVLDEEPLLFHTGMRGLFPLVHEAIASLLDPSRIRWIGFSHFEADECGSLNEWYRAAPHAEAVCSLTGKLVSVDDFAPARPARGLASGEGFTTGQRRYRFVQTPHLPHGWDAGMLFEESTGTLFCSDLLHQNGDVEARTEGDVVGRFERVLRGYLHGPLPDYMPWTPRTRGLLESLAALRPHTLAAMHGSAFTGDCEQTIRDVASMMEVALGTAPGDRAETPTQD